MMGGRSAARTISLDDYFHFYESRDPTPLSLLKLNQIISIHGFLQLHKFQRQAVVDAVNTIALIDPCRSTLGQTVKPCTTVMSVKEVISDLSDLNWQECCITSLETINSPKSNKSDRESRLQMVASTKSRRGRKKGSKSKTVEAAAAAATTVSSEGAWGVNSSSYCAGIGEWQQGKLVAKQKRKLKDLSRGDADSAACSLGSC